MNDLEFLFLGVSVVAVVLAVLAAVFWVGWINGYQHKDSK
jgi:ABC-type transporter Mla subunit MlaD